MFSELMFSGLIFIVVGFLLVGICMVDDWLKGEDDWLNWMKKK